VKSVCWMSLDESVVKMICGKVSCELRLKENRRLTGTEQRSADLSKTADVCVIVIVLISAAVLEYHHHHQVCQLALQDD